MYKALRRLSRPSLPSSKQLFSLIINAMLNHERCLKLIGLLNKKIGFIQVVYCGYPGNKKYLNAYASARQKNLIERYRWRPFLSGFFYHNGKFGLKFFVSSSEEDFNAEDGPERLKQIYENTLRIKTLLHAKELSYAGTLPGLMYKNRVHKDGKERQKVVRAVLKGIEKVRAQVQLSKNCPVIILGAKGYIGREVMRELGTDNCFGVDLNPESKLPEGWPEHLHGQDAIMVNISRAHQLEYYSQRAWPNLVLLNEVYPEPAPSEAQRFREKGGPVYHLSGISGWSLPSFPGGYENAIPCSASWDCPDSEVEIKRLA